MMLEKPSLSVDIGGIVLKNPVMTASGTFGYATEFEGLVDLNRLGGIIVKGLSLKPSSGNPPPRIVETPSGMLNAIGLENIGISAFIKEKLPVLQKFRTPIIVNIYGKTVAEYEELGEIVDAAEGIAGAEVNISCPNVAAGGLAFGVDPKTAARVIQGVRERTQKTVIAKLTPNVTDITVIARAVQDAGADSVSLINTLTGMAVDLVTRRPKLHNITGGLSGPAIKPVALRMVWQAARAVKIPVIGIGGIMNASDALEFLLAGATAIQVGTANFVDPTATINILEGIENFFSENKISDIHDFVGSLNTTPME
jgi:dihydroorotate dehydrogenase (NAD+) catalytic subunit